MAIDRIDSLHETADEFGAIAAKVNESSKARKTHSMEALKYIKESLSVGDKLVSGLKEVSKINTDMRTQHDLIQNSCETMRSNIEIQSGLLAKLNEGKSVKPEFLGVLESKNIGLLGAINEAEEIVKRIKASDNRIDLMDKFILMRKRTQLSSINTLNKLTELSLRDAETAIEGSSSNLVRGLDMVKKIREITGLIKEKNREELETLIKEANMGWKIAEEVNMSSSSQLEFAEKVSEFTNRLHGDSAKIKDMVTAKHHKFTDNLQEITVITVIISVKFKKYLDIVESMQGFTEDLQKEYEPGILNDLITYIFTLCEDIKELGRVNYDMTDISHLNNQIEDETLKTTAHEFELYDNIKKEVAAMTKATAYPIEGSGMNIINGKEIEKFIKGLMDQIAN